MPSFVVYSWMVYRPSHRGRAYHQGISSSPAHRQPTIQRNVFLEIEMNKNHERVKKKLSVHDFSILVAAVPPTPMNWLLYKNWTRTGVCSKNKRSWLQRPASRPGGPAAETNEMPFNMITLLKYTKVKNWTRTGVCSHFFFFFLLSILLLSWTSWPWRRSENASLGFVLCVFFVKPKIIKSWELDSSSLYWTFRKIQESGIG